MIEHAAIKTKDGKVWVAPRPGRHDACFKVIAVGINCDRPMRDESPAEKKRWIDYLGNHEQGFVTDKGDFLGREAAFEHAKACGQRFVLYPGCLVRHGVLGDGRVLHLQKSTHFLDGKEWRVHVKFESSKDPNLWIADDELTRLIGPILTSEDLW